MLKPVAEVLVNQLSYLVPDINSPFIGVHFARLMGGEIEEGPKAALAFKGEGYNNRDFSLCDALDSITYLVLMQFMCKNFIFVLVEFSSSLLMSSFIVKTRKLIPDIY